MRPTFADVACRIIFFSFISSRQPSSPSNRRATTFYLPPPSFPHHPTPPEIPKFRPRGVSPTDLVRRRSSGGYRLGSRRRKPGKRCEAKSTSLAEEIKVQNQEQDKDPFVGFNIGTDVSGLISPTDLVAFLRTKKISHIRLYDANQDILKALAKTRIRVIISVPNNQLLAIGSSNTTAASWIHRNVVAFYPETSSSADGTIPAPTEPSRRLPGFLRLDPKRQPPELLLLTRSVGQTPLGRNLGISGGVGW